ncbi:hypothetical protein JWG45_17660 [Leptospira sp. 201903070]|uniref:Lipoprotein n=1 Tax=Leptospira ainlahdjerensis TaxID=2810033 RepID=A0ABS2UF18_9LEPT|nr:hypothetical protein [Leptospira ainlahdjerensis]MBM9578976.1 hypothetical protein [Leptospira ainlahdjerensis]
MSHKSIPSSIIFLIFSLITIDCSQSEDHSPPILPALLPVVSEASISSVAESKTFATFREIDATQNPLPCLPSPSNPKSLQLKGDQWMAGGGITVYIRDHLTGEGVPLLFVENHLPVFQTVKGRKYLAYLLFFIDGFNDTEIDGQMLVVEFVAKEKDEFNFYVTSQNTGLYVNGKSHESNVQYEPVGQNVLWHTPAERAQARRDNYNLNGGDDYVVEYLFDLTP